MRTLSADACVVPETNPLVKIENCGRVCYKSENRMTPDSAVSFVGKLRQRGHTSVLEHARVKVTSEDRLDQMADLLENSDRFELSVFLAGVMNRLTETDDGFTMNVRDYFALFPDATLKEVSCLTPATDYMTVRFICDRGIANELVRHRVFSFSQESTRYVSYESGVTFIVPEPFVSPEHETNYYLWLNAVRNAESAYLTLLKAGAAPQEARNVLPLSTKTELIMTGTFPQWKALFKLRTASGAHPQMRLLMERLLSRENLPSALKQFRGDYTI